MIHLGIFGKYLRGLFYIYMPACIFGIYVPACIFGGGGSTKSLDFDSLSEKNAFPKGKNYKVSVNLTDLA
jgi:hypothetical protein